MIEFLDSTLAYCAIVLVVAFVWTFLWTKDYKAARVLLIGLLTVAIAGFGINWYVKDWVDIFFTVIGIATYSYILWDWNVE